MMPAEERKSLFTYPGWVEDMKSIENELSDLFWCFDSFKDVKDTRGGKIMQNRQQLYEGTCNNVVRLNNGEFSYYGFERDKEKLVNSFRDGSDISNEMTVLEMKQRVHDQDSHPLLIDIENSSFSYDAWEEDMKEAVATLFDVDSFSIYNREDETKTKLTMMRKKQDIFDGRCNDPYIERLNSVSFNYPSFENDKTTVLQWIIDGSDLWVETGLGDMQMRQKVHEGDQSNKILSSLEKQQLTYDGWKNDTIEVKQILLLNPLCFLFSAESRAQERLEGMKNKEKMNNDDDVISSLLGSGLFTYDTFDDDRKSIIKSYGEGREVQSEIKRIILKQQVYSGIRSHPIITAIDNAVGRDKQCDDNGRTLGKKCIICMEHPKTHTFVPCGHLSLCEECSQSPPYSSIDRNSIKCPMCRQESFMIMKVYGT